MKQCKHEGCENPATYGNQCYPCKGYRQRYKLSKPQVQAILDSQNNRCPLCSKSITLGKYDAVVDHSHKTGLTRSVLCHECNVIVGYLENNKIDLLYLKDYLG